MGKEKAGGPPVHGLIESITSPSGNLSNLRVRSKYLIPENYSLLQ